MMEMRATTKRSYSHCVDRLREPFLASIIFTLICSLVCADHNTAKIKAVVEITPQASFGLRTGWKNIFYERVNYGFVLAPDGTIFVSNPTEDVIYKLDPSGNILGKIGRPGQGPGDLTAPNRLSILDNKYIVVSENPESRRISLFDLSGRFKKLIKTESYAYSALALKEDKIAVLSLYALPNGVDRHTITIIDVESLEAIEVATIDRKMPRGSVESPDLWGQVFLERTAEGQLLVGFSESPTLTLYDVGGKSQKRFDVRYKKTKITNSLKNECFKQIENIDHLSESMKKIFLRTYKRSDVHIPEFAPYYEDLKMDGEGNILVFQHNICSDVNGYSCQAYSDKGAYLGDAVFRFVGCKPAYKGLSGFQFDGHYAYGFIENPGDQFSVKLIKSERRLGD